MSVLRPENITKKLSLHQPQDDVVSGSFILPLTVSFCSDELSNPSLAFFPHKALT